jgi:DNA-binding MarR family transcriptional regulator
MSLSVEEVMEVRRIAREAVHAELREVYRVLYGASEPELLTLRTVWAVERDNGAVNSTPLAVRLYVDPSTAWRKLGELTRAGWVEPIRPRTGGAVRRATGWRLTEKARFALALGRIVERAG